MSVPRRFFVALPAGLLLVSTLFFALVYLQLGAPTPSSEWCFEMNRRKLESAQRCAGPKLVLIGGSGTLFGLKAGELQRKLNLSTVNLGTHAALGAEYILRWARQPLHPGDTVLLCFEYELYEWGKENRRSWAGDIYVDYLMARDPEYFRSLPWSDQAEMALSLPWSRLKRGWIAKLRSPVQPQRSAKFTFYNPDLIDAHGDLTDHSRNRASVTVPLSPDHTAVLNRELSARQGGFRAIAEFCRWAKDHRVRVLAAFPSLYYREEYESRQALAVLQTIEQFYRAQGVPILGTAREAMLPRSDFLDTCYHLTSEAAAARTGRLARYLASGRILTVPPEKP